MTDLTPLSQAEAAVREATVDTAAVQVALAAVELAKTAAAQQQPHHCQQHAPQPQFDSRKWLTIGGLAIVGACTVCFLAMAAALLAVAVAVGGTCATACLLILRSMWRDLRKTR